MSIKHNTMRGKQIDMGALASQNAKKIALGNASMNARGDVVTPLGSVLMTQEQIDAEWLKNQSKQAAVAGLNIKEALRLTPAADLKHADEFEPVNVVDPLPTVAFTPKMVEPLVPDNTANTTLSNTSDSSTVDSTNTSTSGMPTRRRKIVESD